MPLFRLHQLFGHQPMAGFLACRTPFRFPDAVGDFADARVTFGGGAWSIHGYDLRYQHGNRPFGKQNSRGQTLRIAMMCPMSK